MQNRFWNSVRKGAQGERFLRMAGVTNLSEATFLLRDGSTSIHRRCLAARGLGLSGDEAAREILSANDPHDDSPLGRACHRALSDWYERRVAEPRIHGRQTAQESIQKLGAVSVEEIIRMLEDKSTPSERRPEILGALRSRVGVRALIEVLGEGQPQLSWWWPSLTTPTV
jgi:hypothetical protein